VLILYYADTSALVKRYIAEVGSNWLISQVARASGNITVISEVTTVEMFSAFARRFREKRLSMSDLARQRADFLLHVEQEYLVVPLQTQVLEDARSLVGKYPLRTLDAIQLASAAHALQLLGTQLTIVSADRNLLTASAAEGFSTDDPNSHP
jgi:uncharacterized protein